MLRTCTKCLRELSDEHFHKSNKRKHPQCAECKRAFQAKIVAKLKANKICTNCRGPVDEGHHICPACRELVLTNYHNNKNGMRDTNLARLKKIREEEKLAAFDSYGGRKCNCCGETEIAFLSIDHINNDGAKHRKDIANGKYNEGKGIHMARWLRANKYPPGFQVLCMNCNFAKGHFGQCPHELARSNISTSFALNIED